MKSIPANKAFRAFSPVFTLQGPDTSTAVTISVSVDGTNFTALDDTFTGAQIFKDYATNTFLKCSSAVLISDDNAEIVREPVSVSVSTTAGRVVIEKVPGQQPIASGTNVAVGTALLIKFVPTSTSVVDEQGRVTYHSQRFNFWKNGSNVEVSDDNPYFLVVSEDVTLTADITEY